MLLETLGNPERHFFSVHIGGTNGKGSVAAMVYAALRRSGLNAALYSSPHLVDLRERIVVNDSPISHEAFMGWTNRMRSAIEACDASFFEATTAIAFADFAARGAEIAVVEVGLGGRLDATNVVSPLVSAVTNVSLEHTEYLGASLEEIAREKAGIAKPKTPFVVGERDPLLAQLLRESAKARDASVVELPAELMYDGPMTLVGSFQRRNAAVADAVLRQLPSHVRPGPSEIRDGIGSAYVPGRFDRRGKWLFDVAHNRSGIEALVGQMRQSKLPRPIRALVGMVGDKDWEFALPMLQAATDSMWLTVAPSMPCDRLPDIERMVAQTGLDVSAEPDFEVALAAVQRGAGTAVVTGSFFTVGDALALLPGFAPLG
jgi:dihydrofolate synthase/folylpolyglutamate synthase